MDIKYIYTIFFMSILALSCSRKIGSTQAIQKTPETYNYFISADEWNKKSNMFYIATDSATLSYVSEEYKYKTRRAHLSSYYPCIMVTKQNKLVFSVPGKTLVKSNLDLIKDSLELRVRKEKNLEKKPLIKFLKHLKKENTPYYLIKDTSIFYGEQNLKIEYLNSSNTEYECSKVIDSIINFFDSTYKKRKSRPRYTSQTGKTNHKIYLAISCNSKNEITKINSGIYSQIKSIQKIFFENYEPIKYKIFYFEGLSDTLKP